MAERSKHYSEPYAQATFDADAATMAGQGWRVESVDRLPTGIGVVYRNGEHTLLRNIGVGVVLLAVVGSIYLAIGRLPCNGVPAVNAPHSGTIQFGDSFDVGTFAVHGQRATAKIGQTTAFVIHPTQTVTASTVYITYTIGGVDIGPSPFQVDPAPWDVAGSTVNGAFLSEAGTMRMSVTDAGNNTIATGSLTVLP